MVSRGCARYNCITDAAATVDFVRSNNPALANTTKKLLLAEGFSVLSPSKDIRIPWKSRAKKLFSGNADAYVSMEDHGRARSSEYNYR
jgi:hypothetical protein